MCRVDRDEESIPFKREVISEIAHEGRNTAQEIQAGLSLLRVMLDHHSDAREVLGDVEKSERRLKRLLDDLDEYRSSIEVEQQACDLAEVWSAAWTQVTGEPSRTRLEECRLNADPRLLERAFRRTLEYALGGRPGSRRIEVDCSEVECHEKAMVRIALRGGADDSSDEEKVTVSDFQTPRLSLAIARRLVEAQGGRIEIRCRSERGTEVSILLPAGKSPGEA